MHSNGVQNYIKNTTNSKGNIIMKQDTNELTELLISSKLVHLYKGTLFVSKTNVPLKEAEE